MTAAWGAGGVPDTAAVAVVAGTRVRVAEEVPVVDVVHAAEEGHLAAAAASGTEGGGDPCAGNAAAGVVVDSSWAGAVAGEVGPDVLFEGSLEDDRGHWCDMELAPMYYCSPVLGGVKLLFPGQRQAQRRGSEGGNFGDRPSLADGSTGQVHPVGDSCTGSEVGTSAWADHPSAAGSCTAAAAAAGDASGRPLDPESHGSLAVAAASAADSSVAIHRSGPSLFEMIWTVAESFSLM